MKTLNFIGSLEVTLFAMLVVFSVLVFIALIVKLQTFLLVNLPSAINNKKVLEDNKPIEEEHEEISVSSEQEDLEIVAAIMAALSSYMDVPSQKLVIKNIKRLNGNSWRDSAVKNSLR